MALKKKNIDLEDFKGAIDKGLEGVVACTTGISTIKDGNLFYRGYSIQDLAWNSNFEEVLFLLWNARLPFKKELKDFKNKLNSFMKLDEELIENIKKIPNKNVHPMSWLRTAVSFLSLYEESKTGMNSKEGIQRLKGGDKKEEEVTAFILTAKMGQLVALFERIRKGEEYVQPVLSKSIAWNFLYGLKGVQPEPDFVDAFDKCLILHADHELNCSTFSARVTSSSLSDVYSAIVSGIGTLKGPLHGGANEQVMRSLKKIGELENVKPWLEKELGAKRKIMGFGHRVYKNGDPRASVLKELSQRLSQKTSKGKWYEISRLLEKEVKEAKGMLPNVDFYSATVYNGMGISLDLFTPIFSVARIGGWLAHIFEQIEKNRIYRPRAEWSGEKSILKWVPLEKREESHQIQEKKMNKIC